MFVGYAKTVMIVTSGGSSVSKNKLPHELLMVMNSISFMRIITIASCAMFVSGLFKITEPKIVYNIE